MLASTHYPNQSFSCKVFADFIESCTKSTLDRWERFYYTTKSPVEANNWLGFLEEIDGYAASDARKNSINYDDCEAAVKGGLKGTAIMGGHMGVLDDIDSMMLMQDGQAQG